MTVQRLALVCAAPFAVLLTLAGFPIIAFVFGCTVYVTVANLLDDRPGSSHIKDARTGGRRRNG